MIRKMNVTDTDAIREICDLSLGHKTTSEQLKNRIEELAEDSNYCIMVAVDSGDKCVKGFVQAQKYRLLYGGNGWNVIALAVAPEEQGHGWGRQLLETLENHARDQGDTFIRLNSRVERQNAHGFYEHLNYTCDKNQKRFIKYLTK